MHSSYTLKISIPSFLGAQTQGVVARDTTTTLVTPGSSEAPETTRWSQDKKSSVIKETLYVMHKLYHTWLNQPAAEKQSFEQAN